jgi:hypothetical protein
MTVKVVVNEGSIAGILYITPAEHKKHLKPLQCSKIHSVIINSLHKQVKSDLEDTYGAQIDALRGEDNSFGLYILLREFATGTAQ